MTGLSPVFLLYRYTEPERIHCGKFCIPALYTDTRNMYNILYACHYWSERNFTEWILP